MRFKLDENLPREAVALLRDLGLEADTVHDEDLRGAPDSLVAREVRAGRRVLLTLDRDFADIRTYAPHLYSGIVVLRPRRQDKQSVLLLLRRLCLALQTAVPDGQLWILEPDRIRVRGS